MSEFFDLLGLNNIVIVSILLETNYESIVERVSAEAEVPLAEQSFSQAFQSARGALDSLLK